MKRIKIGFTNESYKDNNTFIQYKKTNKFNHKLDYGILSELYFVPKLIENSETLSKWEFIESQELKFNEDELFQIADNFKKLHDSNLVFPKTNHSARVKEYRKILKEKNINIPVLNQYYKRINLILSKSQNNRPLHNDLYTANILKDKNNKIYFIDWEYASMGDKHFDLAYFITGSFLTEEQENIFLNRYETYWEEYLIQQKILVYYLIILWINAQEVKPFDDAPSIKKLIETVELYDYKRQNNLFKR
ncbi:phosphotransferase [Mycoplasmopsis felis]|uniref:phosphotransferase family protein n=1 Tax=Mycoplasmopsis felis TaxID=33923 RepID=UPI002AFF1C3B|nr:phosphotransferase [Mycoplasmopsis felis]WQQ05762.1 phosphotransferase [Mycoplasmopsis felis]